MDTAGSQGNQAFRLQPQKANDDIVSSSSSDEDEEDGQGEEKVTRIENVDSGSDSDAQEHVEEQKVEEEAAGVTVD